MGKITWNKKDSATLPGGRVIIIDAEDFAGRHGDRWYCLREWKPESRESGMITNWPKVENSERRSKAAVKRFAEQLV